MPQAANIAPTNLHVCRMRATRLQASGAALSGATAAYVSDRLISVDLTPEYEDGEDRRVVGGCNQTIVNYREADAFIRWTFAISMGSLEPRLVELMTGMTLFQDTSTIPVPTGLNFPTSAVANPPDVAVEFWAENYEGGAVIADPTYRRYVFPRTRWRMDDATLENDFMPENLVGYSLSNSGWGVGPFADLPASVTAVGENGGLYFVDTIPTAAKTYVTVP